jgi:pimeloyl-ACP methyl ester carboxylesterase
MDGLATLWRHFTCIAYDRRECGQSGGRVEPLDWDLYVEEVKALLDICARSRDAIFKDTMPSGASGEELMRIEIPALILSGADSRHTVSASWTLKELMPQSELWEVLPPHQTGENTLEQILRFTSRFDSAMQAA